MSAILKPQITPEMFESMPDMKGWELIDGKPVEKDRGEVPAPAVPTPPRTPEEFEAMTDMKGWELIDGIPREKEMGAESSFVGGELLQVFGPVVRHGRLGRLFPSDALYQCFPHRPKLVRKPDVSFVRAGRFPNDRPPRGIMRLVPDLVAEVISPDDLFEQVDDKVNDYLLVKVPMIWVVNPALRTVLVYLADGTIRRYTAEQELLGEPLLPDFRVRAADLFPDPLPEGVDATGSEAGAAGPTE